MCGQDVPRSKHTVWAGLLSVKPGGTYSDHWALNANASSSAAAQSYVQLFILHVVTIEVMEPPSADHVVPIAASVLSESQHSIEAPDHSNLRHTSRGQITSTGVVTDKNIHSLLACRPDTLLPSVNFMQQIQNLRKGPVIRKGVKQHVRFCTAVIMSNVLWHRKPCSIDDYRRFDPMCHGVYGTVTG